MAAQKPIERAVARVLELARELARAAGEIQRSRFETEHRIDTKGAPINLVTEVDHACERLIVDAIASERPSDAILAEEGGGADRPDAEWRWIVDPLDGTTNYAHGYPCFCVSIGVERRGVRTVGVVYDPLRDELYWSVRGAGAHRNDEPVSVSKESQLGKALLATGFAYDVHESDRDNLAEFGAFLKTARAVRRDGSAALDLCYVASGRFDGYWELNLRPWDVAAGLLIVEEAGGRTSDCSGGPAAAEQIVASNGALHAAMLAVFAQLA
ncbi:MAG: inositol monophosphatase [Deltaproteobacteria bacterium]|nr:MAG: inositol monophosphatase [Deltaproteobacteria bacterium]